MLAISNLISNGGYLMVANIMDECVYIYISEYLMVAIKMCTGNANIDCLLPMNMYCVPY